MFHRPKTEDQNNAAGVAEAAPPVAEKPEAAPSSVRENVFAQGQQGAYVPQGSVRSQPVSQQPVKTEATEKESKPMSSSDKPSEPVQSGEGFTRPYDIPGTHGFSRPGAAAPQAARAPGQAYAPAAYSPYTATPSATESRANSRRLVVGEGITMSGEIESCDTLIVEGTVEAALKGASILDIAESGMFYGTVEIDECTIAGRFEGDITVHGRLTLKSSGSITGSISYKELAVEAGATIDGKMSPLSSAGKKMEKKDVKGKVPVKGAPLTGAELPFAGHATAAE